jgi:hypothetical protein
MMAHDNIKKEQLYPINKVPPKSVELGLTSNNPSQVKPKVDSIAMTSSILSKRPDLTQDEQSKLRKLIDTVFNENGEPVSSPNTQKTNLITYAAPSAGGILKNIPSEKFSTNKIPQNSNNDNSAQNASIPQLPTLQSRPFAQNTPRQDLTRP